MRAIDKFILHVTHNLFPLNEYSQGEINFLMNKFKEEAEDLNLQISDEQLKKYIERFDALKNNPKVTDKDLRKYSLGKLIKIVTGSAGVEIEDEEKEDDTPDVVYNEGDVTIWNGAKQGNCVTYGEGERWCITRPGGSFWGQYRYGQGEPTFYLAKNRALPDSDKLSFVAIQVLNDGRYKFTNRNNSPGMEGPFSWSELNNRIPWLQEVPNIKNILKYIPLSSAEKSANVYKNNPITFRKWTQLPFTVKKQYLIARQSNREIFSDIENDEFVSKYLPEYPQIATAVAEVPGLIDIELLLKNLDKFSNQERRTITARIREKMDTKLLKSSIPFDVKKLLVTLDKFKTLSNVRLYNSKDGNAIVELELGDDIRINLFTEEDDYPNIKLNKRTSKYLLDYPELDKIPLKNLVKLSKEDIIDKEVVTKVLDGAKKDPNSAIVVKNVDGKEIVLDSNTFASYEVSENGNLVSVPFDNENVQKAFTDSKDNESFQQNAISIFGRDENIPQTIDKDALISVVKATPFNKRTIQYGNEPAIILTAEGDAPFFLVPATINPRQQRPLLSYGGRQDSWRERNTYSNFTADQWKSYFTYLRATNQTFNADGLKTILGNGGYTMSEEAKKAFIANNPPVVDDSQFKPAMNGNTALLINVADPRNSFKISDQSGKLIKANVPPSLARQLLGGGQAAVAAAPAGRRGRPAGVPNAPRPQQPVAGGGNINVGEVMQETGLDVAFLRLPTIDRRKLNVTNASRVNPNGDRGAARRNNILGNRGQVGRVLSIGASKIYIIRLANQQIIASINVQPGNRNYILTGNANGNVMMPLNSPSELLQALQQRGLAEVQNYIVNEYLSANPTHITEFKQLLRKHINEKNEQK